MMATVASTSQRLERVQAAMADEGVSVSFVTPSSDLRYLTGFAGHESERPTLLTVALSDAFLLMPAFETPLAAGVTEVRAVPYEETEDPYAILHDLTGDLAAQSVAVSDRMWAAVLLRLQQVFPRARFQRLQTFLARLRMVKSESELELLRRAAHMGDRAFEKIVELRFTGRTERTIARDLEELLTGEGLAGGRVGPIVASGPNAASPHHEAGDREIHEGDAVVLDFGGSVDGYQADITRTVYVGIPDTEFRHVYDVLRQAQDAGVAAVRPDVPAESVDRAAREVIDAAGYGAFFMHRTGHGIGLDGHEEPFIIASNTLPLRTGMTFSVEPGIYLPGRFGARIEDIVAVTADGQERLNAAPRDLIVVH